MNKIKLFDVYIDNVTMEEAIEMILNNVKKNKKSYVVTPNVDHIVKLQNDSEFREIYDDANIILADGMPLIIASKILKKPLKEKVSGSDLFPILCRESANRGYKVFFLGAQEGVAKKAADKLSKKYKGLQVVGTFSPKWGFENNKEENDKIINMINESGANILFVGLGAPKQEKWIYSNKDKLNVQVSLAIGASFDFIAGNVKRAPLWMQNLCLEWFYRFLKEPKRMFKRYFVDDTVFLKLFIRELKKNNIKR